MNAGHVVNTLRQLVAQMEQSIQEELKGYNPELELDEVEEVVVIDAGSTEAVICSLAFTVTPVGLVQAAATDEVIR